MIYRRLRDDPSKLFCTLLTGLVVLLSTMSGMTGCAGKQGTGAVAGTPYQPPSEGTPIEPPRQLSDFTLTNQDGQAMSLSDLRGKWVVLYFGYTYCPDICPTTLADLVHAKRDLGELANNVAFVMVSVDGERDTPEVLKNYLANFDMDFLGLMGDARTLRKLAPDYGLYFEKRQVEGTSAAYFMDHSAATYLIDPEGRLQMIYGYGIPSEVVSRDLRTVLTRDGSS